jgi:hypothetical protein
MRKVVLVLCLMLGGCVGDQAMNYGTPVPQPVAVAPVAAPPPVLAPIRPYQPAGLAPIPDVPRQAMPGVLPPLRPVYPQ